MVSGTKWIKHQECFRTIAKGASSCNPPLSRQPSRVPVLVASLCPGHAVQCTRSPALVCFGQRWRLWNSLCFVRKRLFLWSEKTNCLQMVHAMQCQCTCPAAGLGEFCSLLWALCPGRLSLIPHSSSCLERSITMSEASPRLFLSMDQKRKTHPGKGGTMCLGVTITDVFFQCVWPKESTHPTRVVWGPRWGGTAQGTHGTWGTTDTEHRCVSSRLHLPWYTGTWDPQHPPRAGLQSPSAVTEDSTSWAGCWPRWSYPISALRQNAACTVSTCIICAICTHLVLLKVLISAGFDLCKNRSIPSVEGNAWWLTLPLLKGMASSHQGRVLRCPLLDTSGGGKELFSLGPCRLGLGQAMWNPSAFCNAVVCGHVVFLMAKAWENDTEEVGMFSALLNTKQGFLTLQQRFPSPIVWGAGLASIQWRTSMKCVVRAMHRKFAWMEHDSTPCSSFCALGCPRRH